MPGRPPKVMARLVPGTRSALPGDFASATEALPMTSGVSVLNALATRMRIAVPPTDTRTRSGRVALWGPRVADPVGAAPHAAIHVAALATAGAPTVRAASQTASARIFKGGIIGLGEPQRYPRGRGHGSRGRNP